MTYKIGDKFLFHRAGFTLFTGGTFVLSAIDNGYYRFNVVKAPQSYPDSTQGFGLVKAEIPMYLTLLSKAERSRKGFAKFSHEHYPLTKAS